MPPRADAKAKQQRKCTMSELDYSAICNMPTYNFELSFSARRQAEQSSGLARALKLELTYACCTHPNP